MAITARFRYAQLAPPAPMVLVSISSPLETTTRTDLPGLIDTGADQTVLPSSLVEELRLTEIAKEVIQGFDASMQILSVYIAMIEIKTFAPIRIPILSSPGVNHIILGRDILNRYSITLDGPNQRMDITETTTNPI